MWFVSQSFNITSKSTWVASDRDKEIPRIHSISNHNYKRVKIKGPNRYLYKYFKIIPLEYCYFIFEYPTRKQF